MLSGSAHLVERKRAADVQVEGPVAGRVADPFKIGDDVRNLDDAVRLAPNP
jgi:hypothetical protein